MNALKDDLAETLEVFREGTPDLNHTDPKVLFKLAGVSTWKELMEKTRRENGR